MYSADLIHLPLLCSNHCCKTFGEGVCQIIIKFISSEIEWRTLFLTVYLYSNSTSSPAPSEKTRHSYYINLPLMVTCSIDVCLLHMELYKLKNKVKILGSSDQRTVLYMFCVSYMHMKNYKQRFELPLFFFFKQWLSWATW